MVKVLSVFLFICLFLNGYSFAGNSDTITVVTYYPSPYGVYKVLRLYPTDDYTPGTACTHEGDLVFDDSESRIMRCKDNGSGGLEWDKPSACPSGYSQAVFNNTYQCIRTSTTITAVCGQSSCVPAGTFTSTAYAGITASGVQTRVAGKFNSSTVCDSGWLAGTSADCNSGGASYHARSGNFGVRATLDLPAGTTCSVQSGCNQSTPWD